MIRFGKGEKYALTSSVPLSQIETSLLLTFKPIASSSIVKDMYTSPLVGVVFVFFM